MHERYVPADVEAAAQSDWRAADAYRSKEDANRKKFYCVSMLPYPSGKLHMGHVRNYTINDVMYRYLRMNGYNTLMPMGWTHSGCRPRTPRWPTACRPRSGRTRTSLT